MQDDHESAGGGIVAWLFVTCAAFVAVFGTGLVAPL